MMLREEVERYSELTGEDGWSVPIIKIGAYLDGYDKGIEDARRMMGKEFTNLTEEDLCDLMCGGPEEEPCEGMISRDLVFDELDKLLGDSPRDAVVHVDCIADMIANLPSIQMETENRTINMVLDQIRAEIKEQYGGCGLINDGLDKALSIIDKYMTESEE